MPRFAKILVVDDSETTRIAIKNVLKSAGYQVTGAENGKTALLLAQKKHFDLVITDIKMPVMNGIEFIKELRDSSQYRSIPALTLTESISFQEAVELRNANIISPGAGLDMSDIPVECLIDGAH